MKKSSLYSKALACAIRDLNHAVNREDANKVYLKWEAFHSNIELKKAVKEKQNKLTKNNYGKKRI